MSLSVARIRKLSGHTGIKVHTEGSKFKCRGQGSNMGIKVQIWSSKVLIWSSKVQMYARDQNVNMEIRVHRDQSSSEGSEYTASEALTFTVDSGASQGGVVETGRGAATRPRDPIVHQTEGVPRALVQLTDVLT